MIYNENFIYYYILFVVYVDQLSSYGELIYLLLFYLLSISSSVTLNICSRVFLVVSIFFISILFISFNNDYFKDYLFAIKFSDPSSEFLLIFKKIT